MLGNVTIGRRLLHFSISFVIGLLIFGSVLIGLQGDVKEEQERLSLYWNGYAKLYIEKTGSWDGLQERLELDRYIYAGEQLAGAIFFASDGSEVASIGDRHSLNHVKKLPILSDGSIVGYTAVQSSYPLNELWSAILLSILASFVIFMSCSYHVYKLAKSSQATERRIAAKLLHKITGSNSTDEADGLEVVEQQLEHLLGKLEKLETVRRTMVAEIAHELRTPLAIMRSQLENALYNGQPLPMEKVISLHEENIRLIKLVKDLQELSLAESGHLPLDKSWFSLSELTESVIEALAVEGEEKNIQAHCTAEQDIRIHADQARIRQVIVNLLGNAYKHARASIAIDVRLEGSNAVVTISDDGWGMEEEDLKHVFDRFYRAGDYSTSKEQAANGNHTSGIGLGLAIVKEFVQAHGGTVQVESQFGKGASFQVSLPVVAD